METRVDVVSIYVYMYSENVSSTLDPCIQTTPNILLGHSKLNL